MNSLRIKKNIPDSILHLWTRVVGCKGRLNSQDSYSEWKEKFWITAENELQASFLSEQMIEKIKNKYKGFFHVFECFEEEGLVLSENKPTNHNPSVHSQIVHIEAPKNFMSEIKECQ